MSGVLMLSVGNSYGSLPINTAAPVVSGTIVEGQTLTTTNGTWSGSPEISGFTYQWQKNSSNIVGATSSTYVLVSGDAGSTVRCVVTATNSVGSIGANSNSTGTIIPAPASQIAYTSAGSYTFTVPTNVYSISTVAVGGGGAGSGGALNGGNSSAFGMTAGGGTTIAVKGEGYVGAPGGVVSGSFTGGGSGGRGGVGSNGGAAGGGGGAGGYSGNGGGGGDQGTYPGYGVVGANGSGGGGGGGAAGGNFGGGGGGGGGGVGILGQGTSGSGATSKDIGGGGGSGGVNGGTCTDSAPNTTGVGGAFGGGGGGDKNYGGGGGGGALAYRNNVAVIPGQTYTIIVGAGGPGSVDSEPGNAAGGVGAVRIIWGLGRSFPSTNTGNV